MRLIDADEFIKRIYDGNTEYSDIQVATIEIMIDKMPSIDAVPVVRCRDCKYSVDYYQDGNCYCRRPSKQMEWIEKGFNWFCADGERRTE